MIRYIGAAMMMLAGTWLGFALSSGLSRRVAALSECFFALRQICARITNVKMPLPQAMAQSGGRFEKAAQNMHLGPYKAIERAFFDSGFSQKDVELLSSQIGMMMAMSAADSPGVCAAAISEMELLLHQAKETADKNSKLYRALGVCGGAAAAILFL
ncbi:MAG: hypothetical protein ACOX8S_09895 [Christensenellales bacterium]